jgi:hypothetical protein
LNDASGHRLHQVRVFQLTQSLKKLHRRKGGGYFGLCINIYKALGTLHPKRTFNRIAANGN